MSLDIQSFIYENPFINHYIIISGDGDLLHVIQRLRLKGKTIHLIGLNKVNHNLLPFVDHTKIYDESAPFLKPITEQQKLNLARKLLHDEHTINLLHHLEELQKKKDFVGLKYFDKYITHELNDEYMREALTKARKLNLISTKSRPNPHNKSNPTTTIEVNKENPITKEILSREINLGKTKNLWELIKF